MRTPTFSLIKANKPKPIVNPHLEPIYSFGVPRQVEMSGIMVDMDAVAQSLWAKDNNVQTANMISKQVGMMSSAWEHRIPEMLFTSEDYPGEAVSAVKALAIASAKGQRIYQITHENVNAVLPVLNISSEVKSDIRDSVTVGKAATVSQNNITVGSWTGVGYIIADAETGAGAYRISGGSNGGFFAAGIIHGFLGALYAVGILTSASPILLYAFFIVLTASFIAMIAILFIEVKAGNDSHLECFKLGLYIGFDVVFAALGITIGIKEWTIFGVEFIAMLFQGTFGAGTFPICL